MKADAQTSPREAALDTGEALRFHRCMDAGAAGKLVETALARMRAAYLAPVFDEWAIVSGSGVVAYAGPRADTFARELAHDIVPLREGLAGQALHVGDVDFAPAATGKRHDAVIRVGETAYLLLNHTSATVEAIRANARWREAQRFLFLLCEQFRADPVA